MNDPSILILKQKLKFVEEALSPSHLRNTIGQFVSKIIVFFTQNVPSLIFAAKYLVFQLVTGFKNPENYRCTN